MATTSDTTIRAPSAMVRAVDRLAASAVLAVTSQHMCGAGELPGPAVAAVRWVLSSVQGGSEFDTWAEPGPARVLVERHAPAGWDDGLVAAPGHAVERRASAGRGFGHGHLITVGDGHLAGGTDPRPGVGAAAGL